MDIVSLLTRMESLGASDLFLTAGKRARARIDGRIRPVSDEILTEEDARRFLTEHLPPGVEERLDSDRDMDLGVSLGSSERYRINLFFQKSCLGMAIRRVPSGALDFGKLHIPTAIREFAESQRGLVLITGATGTGKSTTMAAMLHHINSNFSKHIVTIEDPIEFLHQDNSSIVSQREVGTDTLSFSNALKHVVRQNPDVIFIGEMRDLETMQTAVSAAMTGHLVVATIHTVDVSQTLERIINYFPASMRDQIAQDLGLGLIGIASQRLIPRKDMKGRIPAFEILKATPLVKRIISARDFAEIDGAIKAGGEEGMVTFSRSLVNLCKANRVEVETAARAATNREEFLLAAQGMETGIETLRKGTPAEGGGSEVHMRRLLQAAVRHEASDLIITTGTPPMLRLAGELCPLDLPALTSADTQKLLFSILTPSQRGGFEAEKEIDFALSVSDHFGKDTTGMRDCRFRVNGFYQKGSVACALRLIPQHIPDPEALGIPSIIMDLADRHQGLILVTGPTGHGKSTTLACLIDKINRTRSCHVVTIEDPIEFVHGNQRAVIEQREVNADTRSFAAALKYVLRQDPDVILIGEMRDQETVSAALTAAETGHLVLATLHTNDVVQTIDRIIDMFPGDRQNQIRSQLAASLEAVISERLLPGTGSKNERIAAFEIMLGTTPIRRQIREQKTHQLLGTIETSTKDGMIAMDKALLQLYNANRITRKTFKSIAKDPTRI